MARINPKEVFFKVDPERVVSMLKMVHAGENHDNAVFICSGNHL